MLTEQVQASTPATLESKPGDYPIFVTGGTADNYVITRVNGTLTIVDNTPDLFWTNPGAIVYGTALGPDQLNATSNAPGTFVYNPPAGTILSADRHTPKVTFTPTDMAAWSKAKAEVSLLVHKVPLAIGVEDVARFYGEDTPEFTFQFDGFILGEDEDVLTTAPVARTDADSDSPVGEYPIRVSGAQADNYDISYSRGTLTVKGLKPILTWAEPAPITYGRAIGPKQLNAKSDTPGTFVYNPPPGTLLPAGEHVLRAYFTPSELEKYARAKATVTLVIGKAPLTIQANDHSRAVGQPNPPFTASYQGFLLGEDEDVLEKLPELKTTATPDSPAGDYPITASGTVAENYAITYQPGTLTVTSSAPLIIWPEPEPIIYGIALGPDQLNARAGVAGRFDYKPGMGTLLPAGNHTLVATFVPDDEDSYDRVDTTVTLTVHRAPLTIKAEDRTRCWFERNPSLGVTYSGFVNGENESGLSRTPTVSTGAGLGSEAGQYPITVSEATAANYEITHKDGILTVLGVDQCPAPITEWKPEPIIYGTPLGKEQLNASVGSPDGMDILIAGGFEYSPTMGTLLDAGTHTLRATFKPTAESQYALELTLEMELRVGKAPLTIQADNLSRDAGQPNPPLTVAYEGFVNGEDESVLVTPPSVSTVATPESPAGEYPIIVSGAEAANYSITHINGTLTIGRVIPVITWDTPAQIIYGTELGPDQLNASSDIGGTFLYNPSAGTILSAGEHTLRAYITPADLDTAARAQAGVTLVVEPAILVIRADNQQRKYHEPNPPLTVTYEGFVNGEDEGVLSRLPTVETSATFDVPSGEYPITAKRAEAANYSIQYVDGIMVVEKKDPDIVWPLANSVTYGTPVGPGQLNPQANVAGTFVFNPPAGTLLQAGKHTLRATFTPENLEGHAEVAAEMILEIRKAPLTIQVQNATRGEGESNPAFQFHFEGFVAGEDSGVLSTQPASSTDASPESDAGVYPVTVHGATADNYEINHLGGTLNVVITDTDKDGLSDREEKALGSDPAKADTDGDGLADGDEVNKHGTDPLVADTDKEGLTDGEEINTYGTDPQLADTDGDELTDYEEVKIHGTNPNLADTDEDGLGDGDEVNRHKTQGQDPDSDDDGLNDGDEVNLYKTDPNNADSDGDGLSDGDEVNKHGTSPNNPDTDADGLTDADEINVHKTDPNNPDTDGDGLNDGDEINKHGTNPNNPDTDGDGLTDADEINIHNTDPTNPDTDGDKKNDAVEVNAGTDPNDPDDHPGKVFPPNITRQPAPTHVALGGSASFDVGAQPDPLQFQWFKDDQAVNGAVNDQVVIRNATASALGAYHVRVSNKAGQVTSIKVALKMVYSAPLISAPRQRRLVFEPGQEAVIAPDIISEGPTTFRWFKDGKPVTPPDQESSALNLGRIARENAGLYELRATNLVGTSISQGIRVVVIDPARIGKEIRRYRKAQTPIQGTPVVGPDGSVYYCSTGDDEKGGSLFAILPNGDPKWTLPFKAPLRGSSALAQDGTLYQLSDAGQLIAVDTTQDRGKVKWTFTLPAGAVDHGFYLVEYTNSPAIGEDGTIYFGWMDGWVYAVDPGGELKWRFQAGDAIAAAPSISPKGTIIVPSVDGNVYSLTHDGKEEWRFKTDDQVIARPLVDADGHVYIGSWDGNFYAIYDNGGLKWVVETGAPIWVSAVMRDDGTIYVCSDDNRFYALDRDKENIKWRYDMGEGNYPVSSSPALGLDGSIFIAMSDNKLYAFSLDGDKLWTFQTEGMFWSSPTLSEDARVIFGSDNGTLYVLQGGSPIDKNAPWPSYGGGLLNRGRVQEVVKGELPPVTKPASLEIEAIGAGQDLRLKLMGTPSMNYVIETSLDLKQWIDMNPIQLNAEGAAQSVIQSNKANHQYFRLKENE